MIILLAEVSRVAAWLPRIVFCGECLALGDRRVGIGPENYEKATGRDNPAIVPPAVGMTRRLLSGGRQRCHGLPRYRTSPLFLLYPADAVAKVARRQTRGSTAPAKARLSPPSLRGKRYASVARSARPGSAPGGSRSKRRRGTALLPLPARARCDAARNGQAHGRRPAVLLPVGSY